MTQHYWLDCFVIFQGIRANAAKKLYIFVFFSEGEPPPHVDPGMVLTKILCTENLF